MKNNGSKNCDWNLRHTFKLEHTFPPNYQQKWIFCSYYTKSTWGCCLIMLSCIPLLLFCKRLRDLYEHLSFPLFFYRKCFKGFVPTTLFICSLFPFFICTFLHFANQFMSDFTCTIVTLTSVFSSSLCCRWYLKQHQLIVLALVLHTRQ